MSIFNASTEFPRRGWRCPPAEQLAAYIDGYLSEEQKQPLERHLADCSYCRRSAAATTSDMRCAAPATPAWLRQKAEAQTGQTETKHWRWAWALAPAMAALLVGAVLVELPPKPGKVAPADVPGLSSSVTAPHPASQTGGASAGLTRSPKNPAESLQLLAPAGGSVLEASQLRFRWTAVPKASSYQIRVTTTDGGLVWEGRSEQPSAQAPPTLQLAQGNYFAWVTAYLNDGQELRSAPVQFRVKAKQ